VVSSALIEMQRVIKERYAPADWNIYAAQASDGDNYGSDTDTCIKLLNEEILPICQYYAYVEILTEQEMSRLSDPGDGKVLWRGYRAVDTKWTSFSMKHIAKRGDIYPVFRELFARREGNRQSA